MNKSKFRISFIGVCDNLICKIEIKDDYRSSYEIDYKITGGHGSLAKTTPEITGTTTCLSNPCTLKVPIPKKYTYCGDTIKCEIVARDLCGAESKGLSTISIL